MASGTAMTANLLSTSTFRHHRRCRASPYCTSSPILAPSTSHNRRVDRTSQLVQDGCCLACRIRLGGGRRRLHCQRVSSKFHLHLGTYSFILITIPVLTTNIQSPVLLTIRFREREGNVCDEVGDAAPYVPVISFRRTSPSSSGAV
jgi:hypothetical protein